jgi:hypothetical protein
MGGLSGYALHYETFRKLGLTADEKTAGRISEVSLVGNKMFSRVAGITIALIRCGGSPAGAMWTKRYVTWPSGRPSIQSCETVGGEHRREADVLLNTARFPATLKTLSFGVHGMPSRGDFSVDMRSWCEKLIL